MANQWFRMYAEFASDPKVQVLTEALQRRYVMVLCLHSMDGVKNRPDDEIALALRVTEENWLETKNILIKRELLNKDGTPHGWEKRQYISDIKDPTAAERQKRYRERRNATVTSRPPDSETDTEQKQKVSRGSRFALTQPPEDWIKFCNEKRPDLSAEDTFKSFQDYWIAVPGQKGVKLNWDATWRNWVRNQKQLPHKQTNGFVATQTCKDPDKDKFQTWLKASAENMNQFFSLQKSVGDKAAMEQLKPQWIGH